MSTAIQASERFTALPEEGALAQTVVALDGRNWERSYPRGRGEYDQ